MAHKEDNKHYSNENEKTHESKESRESRKSRESRETPDIPFGVQEPAGLPDWYDEYDEDHDDDF